MICHRCDGHGLVIYDAHIDDNRQPDGYRKVAVAYRCNCPAGAKVSDKIAPEPVQPYLPARKDLE